MKSLFASTLIIGLAGAAAAGENITLCGASPGGLWSLIGVGIDAAVREEDASSNVTYQTSSGGFANIAQLKAGSCDIAIVHVGEALIAKKGSSPFQGPIDGIGAIALLYDKAPMHFLISKDFADKYALESISDLKKGGVPLNLVSNRRGILPAILLEEALNKVGVTYEQIEKDGGSIQFEGSGGAQEIMTDGRADMWVNATFIGTSAIEAIAQARGMTLLSVPSEVNEAMAAEYGSQVVTVPAGSYAWLDRDVQTFGARAALVAADGGDADKIALVTRAIVNHSAKISEVHKAMGGFSPEFAASLEVLDYLPSVRDIYAGK